MKEENLNRLKRCIEAAIQEVGLPIQKKEEEDMVSYYLPIRTDILKEGVPIYISVLSPAEMKITANPVRNVAEQDVMKLMHMMNRINADTIFYGCYIDEDNDVTLTYDLRPVQNEPEAVNQIVQLMDCLVEMMEDIVPQIMDCLRV